MARPKSEPVKPGETLKAYLKRVPRTRDAHVTWWANRYNELFGRKPKKKAA